MALPDRIPCKCGDLIGELVLKQAVVEFTDETGKVQCPPCWHAGIPDIYMLQLIVRS